MPTLTIYRGAPASGKTTAARTAVEKSKGRTKRVERDQIREMLDFGKWSRKNEAVVVETMKTLIRQYLTAGYNVISSDTNLSPEAMRILLLLGKECKAEIVIDNSFMSVPIEECIKRDVKRANGVGESVIWRMYYDYIAPQFHYKPSPDLPFTVLTDLDGTIANIQHRNPFQCEDAENDPVFEHVVCMLRLLKQSGERIIIFSGRNDKYKEQTLKFLEKNNVPFDELYMRPDGDYRKDSELKEEMFDAIIRDKYQVKAVFDDRRTVTHLWRKLGLPLFDVGVGYDF